MSKSYRLDQIKEFNEDLLLRCYELNVRTPELFLSQYQTFPTSFADHLGKTEEEMKKLVETVELYTASEFLEAMQAHKPVKRVYGTLPSHTKRNKPD